MSENTVIKPTIGRVVWFYPKGFRDYIPGDGEKELQPFAAIVTYVHSDNEVNLTVFSDRGVAVPQEGITLVQEGEDIPAGAHCKWMPYQLGQAKKESETKQPETETETKTQTQTTPTPAATKK